MVCCSETDLIFFSSSSAFFFFFLVSIKPRHSWSVMPLLFLFPLYSVASLGLRHALCYLVCKNKTFSTNLFLYKFLWHKQQICCFKKIYKYPFSSVQISPVFPTPFIIFNCTWSASSFSSISLPPLQISTKLVYVQFCVGGSQRRRAPPQEESVQGEGGGG